MKPHRIQCLRLARGLLVALVSLAAPSCDRGATPETDSSPAGTTPGARRALVFAHSSTMGDVRRLMDELERDFEAAHPGVDVRQVVMDDDDYQKFGLLNLFTSTSSPDVYFQWGGFPVERDARAGFALDLTPFLERTGFRANFIPERSFGGEVDGRVYMLPQTLNVTVVLFYNRALFRQHGLSPPGRWEELVAACRTLRAAGVTPIVAGNKDLWMVGNWAAHIASRIVGEDEYHATLSLRAGHRFDADGWVRALGLLAELVELRGFNAGIASLTDAEAKVDFVTGKAAMVPNGDWLVPDIVQARERGATLEHGFFNTPSIEGGAGDQSSVMATSSGYLIGAHTQDAELSWELLETFLAPERQSEWTEQGIVSPVVGATGDNALPEVEDVVALLARAGRVVAPPDTGYAPAGWRAFYDAVQQVLAGNRTPRQALEEAERLIAVFRPRS